MPQFSYFRHSADELKEEGNALYTKKQFDRAAVKYADAISHHDNSKSSILYANRAACHLAMQRDNEAISDAEKAVEINPEYAKAWESIESYQKAVTLLTAKPNPTVAEVSLKMAYVGAMGDVKDKVMEPETMSLPVLMAMARAHEISVPALHTRANMPAIRDAVWYHPKFTTMPPIRLLLIPQNATEPLRQIDLESGPMVKQDICALLQCNLSDSVVLHSVDQVAYARGKLDGAGIGIMHASYEAFMDDMAVFNRPLNSCTSALLHRPDTHGPILVMKTTFIKTKDSGHLARADDILCWENVSEAELRGEEFRKLRQEWITVMGTGDAPHMIQVM